VTTVPVPSAELTVGRQGHYAGAVSRLAAFAADVGVSWGLYTLGVALLNAAVKLVTGHSYTLTNHKTVAFVILTGWEFLYFTYQWAVSGKTLGMAVLGLQVVTKKGGPLSGRQAVLRTIGLGFTLTITLGIGFLGIVYQRERRALNDYFAGTAVVYDWDARAARLRWMARSEASRTSGPRHAAPKGRKDPAAPERPSPATGPAAGSAAEPTAESPSSPAALLTATVSAAPTTTPLPRSGELNDGHNHGLDDGHNDGPAARRLESG